MSRLDAVSVLLTLACLSGCGGGGSGGAGSGGASRLFDSLLPLESFSSGARWTFDVEKSGTGLATNEQRQMTFELDILEDPTGPDIFRFRELGFGGVPKQKNGFGIRRAERGFEMMFFESTTVTEGGLEDRQFEVSLVTPGVLAASSTMEPGDTHSASLFGVIDLFQLEWVGESPQPGFPDAHRFNFSASGPSLASDPRRTPSDTVEVTGSLFLSPDRGVVRLNVTQRYTQAGATVFVSQYSAVRTAGPS